MHINSTIRTTTQRRHEITLDGEAIRALLSQGLVAQGLDPLPHRGYAVTFTVPGGGDWSSTEIDITREHPITVSWTTTETETS